ncbi:MAG: ABC transporter permease [Planctomycetes bacterium]|nr:ABC transporter permease [Planctomycetota bacterium]
MDALRGIIDLLRGLRQQKARTATTLLGLGWGTFSVIVLLAFGTGLEEHMHEQAVAFGESIALVWPSRTTMNFAGLGCGRRVNIEREDVAALAAQIPELGRISPECIAWDQLQVGTKILRATISGVAPAYGALRTWRIEPGGRFLNERDIEDRRRVIVLGNRVRTGLFGRDPVLGRTVILQGLPFTVVGVLSPKRQDSDYSGQDADRICMPVTTHEQVYGDRLVSNFVFRARRADLHPRALRRVYEVLGRRCGFDPDDRQALYVWDRLEDERLRHYAFLGFEIMLAGSGILTMLVGGVGIGNLMFIRVRQRTHEIGIQMALGARPGRILRGVLAETFVLVAMGGLVGFFLSWSVTMVVRLTPAPETIGEPRISPAVTVLTTLLLGSVALLAGYFPARRAARLDPVRALVER